MPRIAEIKKTRKKCMDEESIVTISSDIQTLNNFNPAKQINVINNSVSNNHINTIVSSFENANKN